MEKELTVKDVYNTCNDVEKDALNILINYMYGEYEPYYKLRYAANIILNLKEPKRKVLYFIIGILIEYINKGD